MTSLQKRKRKRKAHKAWRKHVNAVRQLAKKMKLHLIESATMKGPGWDKCRSMVAHDTDWSLDFYVRRVNPPMDIMAQGTLLKVEETLERFWRLKAFL